MPKIIWPTVSAKFGLPSTAKKTDKKRVWLRLVREISPAPFAPKSEEVQQQQMSAIAIELPAMGLLYGVSFDLSCGRCKRRSKSDQGFRASVPGH